jgi:uncharacterized protein (TIGR02145 family)
VFLFTFLINAQTVTGKLVDENDVGLAGIQLQLYVSSNIFNATSGSDGSFIFNNVTGVEENNQLPTGYLVSENFPNPFNPRTRISITLPERENVKVEVFNLLGQSVAGVIEETFEAGTNYIDIELNGLPNGFYISRITLGDKYTVVKKMMLIYGSQHLIASGGTINAQLNKSNSTYLETNLDSLVATSNIIGWKTFTNLPILSDSTLDLGNLTIERFCPGTPTVLYEGKTYHTVQIKSQCWLKENLDVGTRIDGAQEQTNDGTIEKYCYYNSTANCNTYGGLYQWNEAMQYDTIEGTKGICPGGWHIPTYEEFVILRISVNNDGNVLKREDQGTGSGQGTNASGFSALLAGERDPGGGSFGSLDYLAIIWCSTESSTADFSYPMYLYDSSSSIVLGYGLKDGGFSVRCLKD